jgi:predicted nucleic acid-binding protein
MGLILDTSIWIGLADGQFSSHVVLDIAGEDAVFVSAFSLGELGFGVESCPDPAERAMRAAFLRRLESRPILGVTKQTAAAFALLAATIKQSGRSPRPRYNDLWIAAQAIEHGYRLLTANPKDFAGLPGLRLATLQPPFNPPS